MIIKITKQENNKEVRHDFMNFLLSTFNLPRTRRGGFTLIEVMVSLSVFTLVMTTALGSLLALIDSNKKAQSIQTLMTDLNYVIDDISRNARVGTSYRCSHYTNSSNITNIGVPKNCPEGDNLFAFEAVGKDKNLSTDQHVYVFNNSRILKSINGGAVFTPITSEEIVIDSLEFFVFGATSSDKKQPTVVMAIKGQIVVGAKIQTDFNIQTTITQRLPDF